MKQLHSDLVSLGYDGSYCRLAAFAREWKADRQRELQTTGHGTFVPLILLPVRFVGIERLSAVAAEQMMIALSGPLLVLPIAAGLLTRWLPAATICSAGLVISAAGLFWLAHIPVGSDHTLLIGPLLTIGIGISLPWGLMDGLAVSVVPKERAGMATGIFSTTRVAGEGVALAIVSAVLSAMTRLFLGSSHEATTAAQRLATGDLHGAAQTLSGMGELELIHAYNSAFSLLLWLLTGITILTAIVIFTFMGRGTGEAGEMAEESVAARNSGAA